MGIYLFMISVVFHHTIDWNSREHTGDDLLLELGGCLTYMYL